MKKPEHPAKQHWQTVYGGRKVQETSWYQEVPHASLAMIEHTGFDKNAALIDVGGGASLLVDYLLNRGFQDISVLDISSTALDHARERLAGRAARVVWIEADITQYVPDRQYDIWHDRAAFHFLTKTQDQQHYVRVLREALAPGGQAVIATFAPAGPEKCSGLDIVPYDAEKLGVELGKEFVLEEQKEELHVTPADREQLFNFFRYRREP